MNLPKTTIYQKLSEIIATHPGVKVFQERPEIITVFPCITFSLEDSALTYNLDRAISHPSFTAKIDIWGNTSEDTANLLPLVVQKMLELDYRLTFCQDVPDPDGYSHLTTLFNY